MIFPQFHGHPVKRVIYATEAPYESQITVVVQKSVLTSQKKRLRYSKEFKQQGVAKTALNLGEDRSMPAHYMRLAAPAPLGRSRRM